MMPVKELDFFCTPFKAMRKRYLPLLMIYFAYGAAGFSGIAETFFVKEKLNLSAEMLLTIGVWLTIPWTVKVLFGQLVDSVRLGRMGRNFYVYLGATLTAMGYLLLAGMAGQWRFVIDLGSIQFLYVTASLLMVFGLVMQDVVADAMTVDVVDRTQSPDAINQELAMVQLLGRFFLLIAVFVTAGLGGWLTSIFSYEKIFLLALVIPCISVMGVSFVKVTEPLRKPVNQFILFGGLGYVFFVLFMSFSTLRFSQEIIFLVSLSLVLFFIIRLGRDLGPGVLRNMFLALFVIFTFRAVPYVGPALQWWQIDELHFDPAFFGTLAQIGSGLSILGIWFFARLITEKPITHILMVLTLVGGFLSLPIIGMYYGLHHWTLEHFGFGAHTIALVDVALASPFDQLSMVPMLALAARYAPPGNAGTWFALVASLMNLALMGANLWSRELNRIWVVTRETRNAVGAIVTQADYSQLGHLLITTTALGVLLPLFAIFIFKVASK